MRKIILKSGSVFFTIAIVIVSLMSNVFALSVGDVDGDGKVSTSDARMALRASIGLENFKGTVYFTRADYDGDGLISTSDARMILRTSIGLEKEKTIGKEIAYEITDIVNRIEDSDYVDSGKVFSVIIEVKNTGRVPLYMDDCILDYEDNNGHLLQTYDFMSKVPDIIAPGEKGYFYTNGTVAFDSDVTFKNGCNLVPSITLVKASGELKRHKVTDTSLYSSYGTVGCRGRLINDTNETIDAIYVQVVYYDKKGRVLDISGTNLYDIPSNRKTSFDISGIFMHKFSVDDVSNYVVFADEWYYQF